MRRDDDPFDDEDFTEIIDDILDAFSGEAPAGSVGRPESAPPTEDGILADVREYDGEVIVTANLPAGVTKDDVAVRCDGTTTVIALDLRTGTETYEIGLPCHVNRESATAQINNGVLTTTYDEAGSEDSDSTTIDLD